MAYKFNETKAQQTFDRMFGKGSFNSGMNLSRSVGYSKAQVQIAKDNYTERLKAAQKAAREAEKAQRQAQEGDKYNSIFGGTVRNANAAKQIDDMIKNPKKNGAYRNAESIRNDPSLQAELKSRGYTSKKFIDAMYNAASGGKFTSERQYNQFAGNLKKETNAKNKEEKKKQNSTDSLIQKYSGNNSSNSSNKGGLMGFLSKFGKGVKDVGVEVGRAAKAAEQWVNPFDGISQEKAIKDYVNHKQTKGFQELARGANRAVDSATLGAMSNLDKKLNNRTPYYTSQRKIGEGGGTDMITSGLGYLVPGLGATKALKGTAFGAKAGTQGLAKLGQIAKEGAITGGGLGAAEVGIREALNPNDSNYKDNLATIGMGLGAGAIGDPLLHGLGKVATKGLGNIAKNRPLSYKDLNFPINEKNVPFTIGEQTPLQPKNTIQQPTNEALNISPVKSELAATKQQPLITAKKAEAITPKVNDSSVSPKQNEVPNAEDLQTIKDFNSFQKGTNNIYQTADRLPTLQKDRIVTSLDTAKKANIDMQEQLTNDLYNNVVKGLDIKKGTKESALVQDFGEKTLAKKALEKQGIDYKTLPESEVAAVNLDELKKMRPDDWQRFVKADEYFRTRYDQLINQVNKVRSELYPRNPEKLVPKRTDYYHHFQELDGLEGIKNLFDTPANIDPHLEGLSAFTKPRTKWQGFMQRRGNGNYKSDAVGGFLKYLQASSHSINVDPVIPVLRNTANEIADATEHSKNANNIISALNNQANDLAGKTNPYDRSIQELTGRTPIAVVNWLNSRVKSNMILGNLGSVLGQVGNIPLGVGKAKIHSVSGLKDTVEQSVKEILTGNKNAPVYRSLFLKERFSDELFRRFDQRLIDQPKKMAVWLMETVDKASTRFVWNSMYNKGVKQNVINPIKYADTETRKIVAGRGVGEVPLLQKSKTMQVLAPFTLEVGNQWRVLRDMAGEKDAAGILTFLVASYGLNKATEQIRGSGVSFDPIDALISGYTKKEGDTNAKILGAGGSLLGEIVGNVPGGNIATQMVNTESKVPLTNFKFKDVFGDRNPNRFGTGIIASKAITDPTFAILPFGAAQARKTVQGFNAIRKQGYYTDDKEQLAYPIDSTPIKDAQLLMFGPNATKEARNYYDNNRRPLSEKQTDIFKAIRKDGGRANDFYNDTMDKRKFESFVRKLKEVDKDKKLSEQEKKDKTKELIRKLQELKK